MPFTPTTFADGSAGGTPITAAELNKLGTQYAQALADIPTASDTVAGKVELATTAEATTGTDTTRAVTPAGVKAVADTKAASSHTHNASDINAGTLAVLRLGASGTRDATTFLRGDNTWAVPAGGGGGNVATGSGSPLSTVTPSFTGQIYIDTAVVSGTNWGAWMWVAGGTTSSDWRVLRGDTGWRNVTSLITFANVGLAANGGTQIAIRRIDAFVWLRGKALFPGDTTKHDLQWALPTGFTSGGDGTDNLMIPVMSDAANSAGQIFGQIGLREGNQTQWWFNQTAVGNLSFRGEWQTTVAWPTSLPGTPTT